MMRNTNNLRHTIPQLNVPDYIFSAGGIDISVRQFLMIVAAVLIDINLYIELEPFLTSSMSAVVCWGLLVIPIILALIFGWVKVQGQPLEIRLLRMMRYYGRPQIYVWQRATVPETTDFTDDPQDTKKADGNLL